MLNFVLGDCDGNSFNIEAPLSVVLNSEGDVPADDLTVTFAYNSRLTNIINSIEAVDDGNLVFRGVVDEVLNIKNSGMAVTKIKVRSLAALLLDNEAEPVTYVSAAADFIFDRHLKPFGFDKYSADNTVLAGSFKIDKGMTHWQVLENFCKNSYAAAPRITGDGVVMFKGYENSDCICFSDSGGEIEYYSIKENTKSCKPISRVWLKLENYGGYKGIVDNKSEMCRGITRVRYVNATADTSPVDTADRMIEKSNEESYFITLECAGCFIDSMGRNAVVKDSIFGIKENLFVDSLKYSLDKNGEITRIVLKRRNG